MRTRLTDLVGCDSSQAMVTTFHALCVRILRRDGKVLAIDLPSRRVGRQGLDLVRYVAGRLLLYAAIVAGGGFVLVPFIWMLSASLKDEAQIFAQPPVWIPNPVYWTNYPEGLAQLPFDIFFRNTVIITAATMLGEILSCSLVAYGFARLRFPGKRALFVLVLSTMMVPFYVVMIPRFILFKELGWINTLLPLTVPAFFGGSAFFIFLFRQFFMTIPFELEDAARIDGASTWDCYARIILPLSKPVLGAVAIFSFINHWNDFIGPLIYLNSMNNYTLALGLNMLRVSQGGMRWNYLMAASFAVLLPCLILFFCFQRIFIQGVVFTGVKG
jgi:multiple sugar transport system permease protein